MSETSNIGKKMRVGGLITVAISVLIGVLFMFAVGNSCGFLGSLIVVFSLLASLIGAVIFVSGLIIQRRSRRSNSEY